jgi:hypothetical protein
MERLVYKDIQAAFDMLANSRNKDTLNISEVKVIHSRMMPDEVIMVDKDIIYTSLRNYYNLIFATASITEATDQCVRFAKDYINVTIEECADREIEKINERADDLLGKSEYDYIEQVIDWHTFLINYGI